MKNEKDNIRKLNDLIEFLKKEIQKEYEIRPIGLDSIIILQMKLIEVLERKIAAIRRGDI